VAIPATFPDVVIMILPIVNLKIVVRVPPNGKDRLSNCRRIIRRRERDAEFEMTAGIGEDSLLNVVRRRKP
jgi:hypothetical protein